MAKTLDQILEERGCKKVPDDHWIYSEGASAILVSGCPKSSSGEGTSKPVVTATAALAETLMKALRTAQMDDESISADEVPNLVDLEDGQSVNWVSSTWLPPQLVSLYACKVKGEKSILIGTRHGDGGVLESIDGPWHSLEDAKASYVDVLEGWSDL